MKSSPRGPPHPNKLGWAEYHHRKLGTAGALSASQSGLGRVIQFLPTVALPIQTTGLEDTYRRETYRVVMVNQLRPTQHMNANTKECQTKVDGNLKEDSGEKDNQTQASYIQ